MDEKQVFPDDDILESYNPLKVDYLDDEEDKDFDTPPIASQAAQPPMRPGEGNRLHAPTGKSDPRPANLRLQELFSRMPGREPVLFGILSFCRTAAPVSLVNKEIARLSQHRKSVYAPADLTALLEKAGGLAKTTEDGLPYDESAAAEGHIVLIDGIEYLEPSTPPQVYWKTSPAGHEFLETDNPTLRLGQLLEKDATYASIYQRVLKCCATDGGASPEDITSVVDGDSLVRQPLKTAPYFTNNLAKAGGVEWRGTWTITSSGQMALEALEQNGPVDLNAIRATLSGQNNKEL